MTGSAIEWTDEATRQLDQAHDYIALSNSEEVAERITTQIIAAIHDPRDLPRGAKMA